MCTAITVQTPQREVYFGRTMDFSYQLEPELYFIPKGYEWKNLLNTHKIRNQYSFMGIGQDISRIIFADGVNEMGFAAAMLYFPGYAVYDPIASPDSRGLSITALEVVSFLLGMCHSADHAASLLRSVRIVGAEDSVTHSIAPLHWIMADQSGKCLVAEKTADGLHIMENLIGVLANSPDLPWHLTNLRNYMNVTPDQPPEREWDSVKLTPFGQGGGTFGLPGDYTSPSRFVRTAWLKSHTPIPADRQAAVNTCFHIMNSVTIPKGAVMTSRGTPSYTQYTAFIDLSAKEYFFKTYDNSRITSAKLPSASGGDLKALPLVSLNKPTQFDRLEV